MMEYFAYKKVKKHQAEKKASEGNPAPLLDEQDETFLRRVISAEGTPPPLPARPHDLPEAGDSTGNASQMVVHDGNTVAEEKEKEVLHHRHTSKDKGKGKEKEKENEKPAMKEEKKPGRFSFLSRVGTKKNKDGLKADAKVVTPNEAAAEENDINKVLEDLNLSAINNRAFSISDESQQVLQKFTVILKDLVNGVPTAYDDLVALLEDSQGTLAKSYDHLPSFLQKLVTQLPDKLTKNLAPELLAVATEAQAFNTAAAAGGSAEGLGGAAGIGAAAMKFLKPTSLKDLVTKPGAVVSMLKAIMNALKLRWPAFMGTNVLLSLGLFVLLFVFWYCHKRGREVRLEREAKVDSEGRIIELEDDVMLAGAPANGESSSSQQPAASSRNSEREREHGSSREHRSRQSSRERDREHRSSRENRSRPSSWEREREREHRHERRERDREHDRERDHVERRPTSRRSDEKDQRRKEKEVERERR